MYVLKRSGKKESVHFDKITSRIQKLCFGLDTKVRPFLELARPCMYSDGVVPALCLNDVRPLSHHDFFRRFPHHYHSMSNPLSLLKKLSKAFTLV